MAANLRLGAANVQLSPSSIRTSNMRAGHRRILLCSRPFRLLCDPSSLAAAKFCTGASPFSRGYATTTQPRPAPTIPRTTDKVAVLGGGLTGLTTAYYLAKHLPSAKITIYESSHRLGGWIDTIKTNVQTEDGSPAQALFERGARSYTPLSAPGRIDPLVVMEIAKELGLMEDMISANATTPLGQRYVYYPDHLCNVSFPQITELSTFEAARELYQVFNRLINEPLYWDVAKAMWHRLQADGSGVTNIQPWDADGMFYDIYGEQPDQSLGSYVAKLTGGPDIANNALSAVCHGVYGGDVWKLSVASNVFSRPWLTDRIKAPPGENLADFYNINDLHLLVDMESKGVFRKGPGSGLSSKHVMSFFKGGFNTLTNAIEKSLKANPKVQFRKGTEVSRVEFDPIWQKVKIKTTQKSEESYDKVVSTLFSKQLNDLTKNAIPSLSTEEAVSIQVVNLFYPKPYLNPPGVGYLIPTGIDYNKENPRGALGVLFDSDREALTRADGQATGTNLTVMLGGHYWEALDPRDPGEWPSDEGCIDTAKKLVQRHLGISPDEPVFASTKKCVECIPQHYVGHRQRMAAAHKELEKAYRGQLAVVGGSYTNPGVAPSMRAARDVAMQIAGEARGKEVSIYYPTLHVGKTGLAKFADSKMLDSFVHQSPWTAKYIDYETAVTWRD